MPTNRRYNTTFMDAGNTFLISMQALVLVGNIVTGRYQANRFDKQQKGISHTVWAIWYTLAVIIIYLFGYGFNWKWIGILFAAALVVQRIPVFNTALNFSRRNRMPIFYTHPVWNDKKNNSWQDRIWGKWYPFVFFLSIAILITLQFFIYG